MGKRAMSEAAKEEKANAILDTAERIFATTEYEDLKMIDIAKEMGISKGILFVYFKTKEMLFLQLLIREYSRRLDKFEKLINGSKVGNYNDFKNLVIDEMSDIIDNAPIYIRLCAIRSAILEKNVDVESMIIIKKALHERIVFLAGKFHKKYDVFTKEEIIDIFLTQESIVVGCKLSATLPEEITTIIDEYGLKSFKVDFKKNAIKTMEYYLDGLYYSKK